MNETRYKSKLFSFFLNRLLKGADDLQLQKPIKLEYGGGYKIFFFDDIEFYEGKMNKILIADE